MLQVNIEVSLQEGKIRQLTGKKLAENRAGLCIKSFSYLENSCCVKEVRVLYMHQKYLMVFSSNTSLVFIAILKIVAFSINFTSIVKIIFHNFVACIVILYLLFVSLMESTI